MTFAQIKHEREWWEQVHNYPIVNWRFEDPDRRRAGYNGDFPYPAPVQAGQTFRISQEWYDYIRDIQSFVKARSPIDYPVGWPKALEMGATSWLYVDNDDEYAEREQARPGAKTQSLLSDWAYFRVKERRNGFTWVECLDSRQSPPKVADVNPITHPWLFHQFSSIDKFGTRGNAPDGQVFFMPYISGDGKMRVKDVQCRYINELPKDIHLIPFPYKEKPPMTRAHLVDISYWQAPYYDDGVDEGLPLHGVIQKVAHGLIDYTDPNGWSYQNWWKVQYDSIASFEVLMGYALITSTEDPIAQSNLVIDIENRNRHAMVAFDYEGAWAYTADGANRIKRACDNYRIKTGRKAILYLNYSTYIYLLGELGAAWLSSVIIWLAGGPDYRNVPLVEAQHDGYDPFPSVDWKILQYSADGNRAADELDFGELEAAAIDYNMFKGTVAELRAFVGLDDPPPDPPTGCETEVLNAVIADRERIIDTINRMELP